MEIQIFNPTQAQPLPEISWNYAELKQQLEAGLANYKGLAYSDDQIGEAKKDRAKLNKLADAIDGKRKEMKALYLRPYEAFEAQAKELVGMVKATVREIDDQGLRGRQKGGKAPGHPRAISGYDWRSGGAGAL